jgi:hypothetical protein
MDLLTPTDHAGAYEWASVLLAHAMIGLGLTAAVSALLRWADDEAWLGHVGEVALLLVAFVYGVAWEGLAQRYGAGLMDSAVDTLAVFCGGWIGLAAWRRRGVAIAAGMAVMAFVAWLGIRRRS